MLSGWDIFAACVFVLLALGAAGWLARRILDNPMGTVEGGLAWCITRTYVRLVHRVRVVGLQNMPRTRRAGPLIVIANHSSGVDPALLQAVCPFLIRFVMAADMRRPELEPFWRWLRVIFVDRRTGSAESLRDAVQALRDGAVIGIFPEGYIERPPEQLLPFQPGIGLLIRRSSAPVLPVLIRGTPATPTAWGSLIRRSRSVVEFMPIISYADRKLSAGEIASDLQSRYLAWTGWPMERTPDARITSELRSG